MFHIRRLLESDLDECEAIVRAHWGDEVATSARREMDEMFFSNSQWPPEYIIAEDDTGIIGFAGYKSAWLMSNAWELIWINVRADRQGMGVGQILTETRILDIDHRGGTLVLLMTQKPAFFEKFDFKTVEIYDGWNLMVRQLRRVTVHADRAR